MEYLMEGRIHHWNSLSLDEAQQRKLLLHVCILLKYSSICHWLEPVHFRAGDKLVTHARPRLFKLLATNEIIVSLLFERLISVSTGPPNHLSPGTRPDLNYRVINRTFFPAHISDDYAAYGAVQRTELCRSRLATNDILRSAARGRPIIVEWERRKAFGGLSLVRSFLRTPDDKLNRRPGNDRPAVGGMASGAKGPSP
ncbi:hypothetical protein EVAR_34519_1 [Eumeta japonica]|uniref:Uncharacterized protein n=1 Tax=Eumeta variegata TaxID=151549 RepID=A0A4C1Z8C8_EUMVA|nr:hypothetical protein EVAR_34519_1 [Eumeta japonica]